MARKCPNCLAPTKKELVFHRRTGPNNQPQLYHYVRRYTCPEGCTSVLDFSKAKQLRPGVTPMVLPQKEKLDKEPDFNDKLLAIGLGTSLILFAVGILFMPTSIPVKLATIGGLSALVFAIYSFANQRVVLPESFPRPVPEPVIIETADTEEAAASVATATKKSGPEAKPAPEITFHDVIPELEPVDGPIPMSVVLGDELYEITLNKGDNMLDAALERDVEIDFSCREGNCDSCVVRIFAGMNNLPEPTQEDRDMIDDEDIAKGYRLACMTKVNGPVNVFQE